MNKQLRVLIIDGHEISRGALSALLRTEGLDVVADVAGGSRGIAAVRALAPDLVLFDVAAGDDHMLDTLDALKAAPSKPTVVLTSSTDQSRLGMLPNSLPFLAKADICARALLDSTRQSGEEAPLE